MEKVFLNCETFVLQHHGSRSVISIVEAIKLVREGILADRRLETAAYAAAKPVDHAQEAIDAKKKREADLEVAKAAHQAGHLNLAIKKMRKALESAPPK